jgi:integral membrane protein (TIGR00529 family)
MKYNLYNNLGRGTTMIQLASVIISFLLIPVLGRTKLKLSYVLLISAGVLSLISGIGFESTAQSVAELFKGSSLNTVLTVLMVSVLGGLMKHYKTLDKIVETILLIVSSKKIILMIIPALIGILIIPGGALLSAPFINNLGEEMNIAPPKRAAINLVFRHVAMFLLPFSTGLLVIASSMPEINITKLVMFNLAYVVPVLFVGYMLYIKNIESEKSTLKKEDAGKNFLKLLLYTSPITICVILNALTGLPFYITMIASVVCVYFLSDKKDFMKITIKSINYHTVLMVAIILLLKEMILKMDDLLLIFGNLFKQSSSTFSVLVIFLVSSVFFGIITGNQTAALAIILPMVSQLNVSGNMLYIYVYFAFASAFIGYFFSPIHLCQAFTIQLMNVTTLELYKEYRYYLLFSLIVLFISAFILIAIFA